MMTVGMSGNVHGVDRTAQHLLECASGRPAEVRRKSLGQLPFTCPYRGELCSSHMPESGRKAPCGIASADHTPSHHSRHPGPLFADYFPAHLYFVACGPIQCPST